MKLWHMFALLVLSGTGCFTTDRDTGKVKLQESPARKEVPGREFNLTPSKNYRFNNGMMIMTTEFNPEYRDPGNCYR